MKHNTESTVKLFLKLCFSRLKIGKMIDEKDAFKDL